MFEVMLRLRGEAAANPYSVYQNRGCFCPARACVMSGDLFDCHDRDATGV